MQHLHTVSIVGSSPTSTTIKGIIMIVPKTWSTLTEFVTWYKANNYPWRVPQTAQVYPTEVSYSCCIFRQDVYQVEIYLARPNFTSTQHSHPFEQQIIFLGGHMMGNRDGITTSGSAGNDIDRCTDTQVPGKDSFGIGLPLLSGQWHEVSAGRQGFIFLNCQRWPSTEAMTSAVVAYNGEPLGDMHKQIISAV